MNPKDQLHLVVYWSQEDGWCVTDMEPSSQGFIWGEPDEYGRDWRYAETDEEFAVYDKMTDLIAQLPNPLTELMPFDND